MKEPAAPRHVWRWTRRVPSAREEEWRARLAFLGTALAIHHRPRGKTARLEAYGRRDELGRLRSEFGGALQRIDAAAIAARANAPRRALRIAPDLAVIDVHGRWPAAEKKPRILLRIAAAMAFGTGEHATTSSCLRLVRGETSRHDSDWVMLDIGTGSGILAIAAEKLGASRVDAFDCDMRALRAARTNATRNRCRAIRFAIADLLRWQPSRRYDLVVANVFSEVLRAAAPRIIRAPRPGGALILSGILREQEAGTLATFVARGLRVEKVLRRGKWSTFLLRAPELAARVRRQSAEKDR